MDHAAILLQSSQEDERYQSSSDAVLEMSRSYLPVGHPGPPVQQDVMVTSTMELWALREGRGIGFAYLVKGA